MAPHQEHETEERQVLVVVVAMHSRQELVV
jgi:hypothetical protein